MTTPRARTTVAWSANGASDSSWYLRAWLAITLAHMSMLVSTVFNDSRIKIPAKRCSLPVSWPGRSRWTAIPMTWSWVSQAFSPPDVRTPLCFDHMPMMAGDSPMVLNSKAATKHASFACLVDLAASTRPANSSVNKLPKRPTANLLTPREVSTDLAWSSSACSAPSGICFHATTAKAVMVGATTSMDSASNQISAIKPPTRDHNSRPSATIGSSISGEQRFKLTARLTMALYCAPAQSIEPINDKTAASPPSVGPKRWIMRSDIVSCLPTNGLSNQPRTKRQAAAPKGSSRMAGTAWLHATSPVKPVIFSEPTQLATKLNAMTRTGNIYQIRQFRAKRRLIGAGKSGIEALEPAVAYRWNWSRFGLSFVSPLDFRSLGLSWGHLDDVDTTGL